MVYSCNPGFCHLFIVDLNHFQSSKNSQRLLLDNRVGVNALGGITAMLRRSRHEI